MEAILLLLVVAIPVAAAVKGLGRRWVWFGCSVAALVLALISYAISTRATAAALNELERPIQAPQSYQPPASQGSTPPMSQPGSQGGMTANRPFSTLRLAAYSRLATHFFASACLGLLLAGIFFRGATTLQPQPTTPAAEVRPPFALPVFRPVEQLRVAAREVRDITVLDLSGRLVLGEGCDTLRSHLRELFAAKQTRILLNLQDLSRVDSAGIGSLVEAVIETAKHGGQLKLVNVPRLVQGVFTVHRLSTVFEIYDSENAATASFP